MQDLLHGEWKFGDVSNVAVDAQDHVWILPEATDSSRGFDAAGNFIQGWRGAAEGYEWPEGEHGVHVDRKTLEILGSFGGANAHHIGVDSKGNLYTAQTGQRRAQEFVRSRERGILLIPPANASRTLPA